MRRRERPTIARHGQIAHARTDVAIAQVIELLLKVLNVSPRFSDFRLCLGYDLSIARRRSHLRGSLDELLLALYPAVDFLRGRAIFHGCNVLSP